MIVYCNGDEFFIWLEMGDGGGEKGKGKRGKRGKSGRGGRGGRGLSE